MINPSDERFGYVIGGLDEKRAVKKLFSMVRFDHDPQEEDYRLDVVRRFDPLPEPRVYSSAIIIRS